MLNWGLAGCRQTAVAALKLPLFERLKLPHARRARATRLDSEVGGELALFFFLARAANCVLNWVCWRAVGSVPAASPPTEAREDKVLVRFVGQAPGGLLPGRFQVLPAALSEAAGKFSCFSAQLLTENLSSRCFFTRVSIRLISLRR